MNVSTFFTQFIKGEFNVKEIKKEKLTQKFLKVVSLSYVYGKIVQSRSKGRMTDLRSTGLSFRRNEASKHCPTFVIG